jgi:hypothetical protein
MESEEELEEEQILDVIKFFQLIGFFKSKLKRVVVKKKIRRLRSECAMKTMGRGKAGTDDACLVMLCGGSLSEEHLSSGSYLHLEWLGVFDNGTVLESIRNVNDEECVFFFFFC